MTLTSQDWEDLHELMYVELQNKMPDIQRGCLRFAALN